MRVALMVLLAACGTDPVADDSADTDTDTDTDSDTVVVDPCADVTCENGGTCDDVDGDAVCTCVAPYEGPTCEAEPVYFPSTMGTTLGDNFQDFGIHSRVQLRVQSTDGPTTPVAITSVRLRRDDTTSVDSLAFDQAIVKLGVAAQAFGDVFADNFSGSPTVVYDGPLSIGANGTDTLAFDDWVIVVDPPYAWDPADGKLLVEMLFPDGHQTQPNMRIDCNNDGQIAMRMSNRPYGDQGVSGPPVEANNVSGCGYALAVGMQ